MRNREMALKFVNVMSCALTSLACSILGAILLALLLGPVRANDEGDKRASWPPRRGLKQLQTSSQGLYKGS